MNGGRSSAQVFVGSRPYSVVLPVAGYVVVLLVTGVLGITISATAGLVAALLAAPGLVVVVQLGWRQGRTTRLGFVLVLLVAPVVVGALMNVVALRSAEVTRGVRWGLIVALLSVPAAMLLLRSGVFRARPRVFLSYRRAQAAHVVDRIDEALVHRYGRRNVFHDIRSIQPGENFLQRTDAVLRRSDAVLAVIGPGWAQVRDDHGRRRLDQPSDYVRAELELALNEDIRVVPVLVENAELPTVQDLPPSLARLPYLEAELLRPGADWANDVRRLLARLEEARIHVKVRSFERSRSSRRRRWSAVAALLLVMVAQIAVANAAADGWNQISTFVSPDGRRVLSISDRGAPPGRAVLRLWSGSDARLLRTVRYPGRDVRTVAWAPQGDRFVTGDSSGRIIVWDGRTLTPGPSLPLFVGVAFGLAWSPDGANVAGLDDLGTLRVWNSRTGRVSAQKSAVTSSSVLSAVQWSPDGELLAAYGSGDNPLTVLRWTPGQLETVYRRAASYHYTAEWAPSGRTLAVAASDGPYLVRFDRGATRPARIVLERPGRQRIEQFSWSPNSALLIGVDATSSATAAIWAGTGPLRTTLTLSSPSEWLISPELVWSPDARRFAVGDDGNIRVFSVDQGVQGDLRAPDRGELLSWTATGLETMAAPPDELAFEFSRARPRGDGTDWRWERVRTFRITPSQGLMTWLGAS